MADNISSPAPSPRLDEAKDFILDNLEEGMEVSELEKMAKAAGISGETLKNARAVLVKDKRIAVKNFGFGKDKKWCLYTVHETENPINKKCSK